MYSSLYEMTEPVVGKRKSKDSQEFDQPPNKKQDSFSGDEAYCSFSYQSLRGDETDMSSNEDILEIEEEPKLITAEMLQINYKYLKSEMESRELIDILHQYEVFTDEFLENCKTTPSRMRRNDLLIKEIYYIAINKDSEVLHQFTTSLIQTEQSYLIDHLKNHSSSVYSEEKYSASKSNQFLRKLNEDDTIEPRDFIDDLIENKSMSFRDHEDVTRLDLRKKRVKFVRKLVKSSKRKSAKIIKTVEKAYPKLFRDVENNDERSIVQQTGGAAVNIKLNLKCNGMEQELRAIENRSVQNFKRKGHKNDVIMNDLVEECRSLFEGLKISSIVIQLLTRDENSLGKIVSLVQQGKAVDWLLSILEEKDKRRLILLGVTKLQVLVTVNTEGNLGNLLLGQDCICQLNQQNIRKNKDTVTGMITDVSTLFEQMSSFSDSPPHLLSRIEKSEDKCATLLDCLIKDDVPQVWYCLLEEHIKKEAHSVEELLVETLDRNIEFDGNDIKIHEEYLKNELELRTFLPIIRSWMNEKSEKILSKINKCSSRRSRMEQFMTFLLCEEDLGWFWEEVKIRHPYVWETMTTSRRSSEQSEKDVLAIKLMNDTVVEEIDPIRLTKYLRDETITDLGFNDFKDIQSRKSRAQFILNRLTADTIGDFMTALRQGGYEHIYRQIKAGSLAKQYVCPRIHSIKRPKRKIYKSVFDLPTKLCSDEVPTCWVNSNKAGESTLPTFSTHSTGYEYASAQTSGIKSPASVGSLKDSESGFISGSDDFTCEIANTHDFDDEGISSCSPVSPTSLSPDSSTKAVKPSSRSRETLQRKDFKRMLQLMDSDISASRERILFCSHLRPNRFRLGRKVTAQSHYGPDYSLIEITNVHSLTVLH
ncbi:uncharacterized protein LOC132756764, partial [Ruditapes philippinarum]|uniref:uncharacterized protein LOC132756764 n=1 Tax=Ruditapes philippinarum TaxID=129788 RepID=UPI00295BF279